MTDKCVSSSGLQTKTTGCMNLERTGTLSLSFYLGVAVMSVFIWLAVPLMRASAAGSVRRTIQRN